MFLHCSQVFSSNLFFRETSAIAEYRVIIYHMPPALDWGCEKGAGSLLFCVLTLECLYPRSTHCTIVNVLSHTSVQHLPLVFCYGSLFLTQQRKLWCTHSHCIFSFRSAWWGSLRQWKNNTQDQSCAYRKPDRLLHRVKRIWHGHQNYKCVIL